MIFNQNTIFFPENAFENVVCNTAAIMFRSNKITVSCIAGLNVLSVSSWVVLLAATYRYPHLHLPSTRGTAPSSSWVASTYWHELCQGRHLHLKRTAIKAINPLHAKFFRGNISIYSHFMSLLHIDMTQVLKILPQVRPGPIYSTQSISWLLMSWRHKEPGHQQPWY